MLKSLATPFLVALFLASSGYYYTSSRNPPTTYGKAVQQPKGSGGIGQPQAKGQLPPQQATPPKLQDVDAILVIDNSGSMFGYTCSNHSAISANDAQQLRIAGAEVVIGALSADLKPRDTKLGIVNFGDDVHLVRKLTQLSNDDATVRSQLVGAIQNPQCQGDTNILDAIKVARDELRSERATPGNIPAIIFLTDGLPTSGGGLPEISHMLDDLGDVRFYAVLLGQDSSLQRFKQYWSGEANRRPNVSVFSLTSNKEIPGIYKEIAADLNNIPELANAPALPPGPRVEVPVPANVQQTVFTILKPAASVQIAIQDPQGQDAHQLPPDRFRSLSGKSIVEVFVVGRPTAGTWVISSVSGEEITVLQPEFKSIYQVQLVQPGPQEVLAVDQAADIVVQVVDSEIGNLLTDNFSFIASYRLKGALPATDTSLALTPGTIQGQYSIQLPDHTFTDGAEYFFSFMAQDGAGLRSVASEYMLAAGRMPTITTLTAAPTKAYVDQPITLVVKVANADSVNGQSLPRIAQPLPGGVAPLFTPSSPITGSSAISGTGVMEFQTKLPALTKPGDYMIAVAYAGKTKLQRDFNSIRNIKITVVERELTIWMRNIALALAILLGAFLLFRFVLLSPLIPVFQKIGISPQGYIRMTPPGQQYANPEQDVTRLLQMRRKLRKLTIGVGSGFDIGLEPDLSTEQPSADDAPPPRKPSLRDRLMGKPAAGYIGKRGRDTYIKAGSSSRTFGSGASDIEIANNLVECSLKSLDDSTSTDESAA